MTGILPQIRSMKYPCIGRRDDQISQWGLSLVTPSLYIETVAHTSPDPGLFAW